MINVGVMDLACAKPVFGKDVFHAVVRACASRVLPSCPSRGLAAQVVVVRSHVCFLGRAIEGVGRTPRQDGTGGGGPVARHFLTLGATKDLGDWVR